MAYYFSVTGVRAIVLFDDFSFAFSTVHDRPLFISKEWKLQLQGFYHSTCK